MHACAFVCVCVCVCVCVRDLMSYWRNFISFRRVRLSHCDRNAQSLIKFKYPVKYFLIVSFKLKSSDPCKRILQRYKGIIAMTVL